MVSFQLNFLFKSQVSRHSHSLTYGGSDLNIRTWGTPQNLGVDPALLLPVYSLSPHSKLIPVPLCQPPYLEILSTWDSQWPHQAGTQVIHTVLSDLHYDLSILTLNAVKFLTAAAFCKLCLLS